MPLELRHCRQCGIAFPFMAAPSKVKRGEGQCCSRSCSAVFHRTGKRSNNWQGGRKVTESGHVLIYVPGDPHARPDGYAMEHRVVLAATVGRALTSVEVVHHKDGDPSNNAPDNLALLPSQSDHMRIHRYKNPEVHQWT